jgi:putative alpha-1,2-mannosidase
MISLALFSKTEPKMLHLANLWNYAEGLSTQYDKLFVSNPHELAVLIGQATQFSDWQMFITDSRVQDYIDKIHYTQAGIIVSKYMDPDIHVGMADSAKLNSAIRYRDDHKPSFAVPTQYIYIQTPLTKDEKEFLPNVPENNRSPI